jgi:DNA-directed RNA polymerase beta' subunit
MGTIDSNVACGTCAKIDNECKGHYGRIDLAVKIPHPLANDYILYNLIKIQNYLNKTFL